MAETIKLEIYRYQPGRDRPDDPPRYSTYEVPYNKDWVVLDALNWIKDHEDGSLSYRWSCRMAVCGSCGMMVNGIPRLTCATFLHEYYPNPIKVEPLENFPVERDLVINMDDFMEKLHKVKPWIIRKQKDPLVKDGKIAPLKQTPAQLARYKQFSMCINCTLCYAACPVYGRHDDFLGPAALALGQRYLLDSRDEADEERKQILFSGEGIWECTFVGECSTVCPKHVDPSGAIQQAKMPAAIDFMKRLLFPSKGEKA